MDNAELNASFEHIYEALSFEKVKCQGNPSLTAHVYRKLAAQQYFGANLANKSDERDACFNVYDQTMNEYFNVMDEKDPSKGLDNCSRGVQALCDGFRNESKQWHLADLKNNSIFQMLERELKQQTASSNSVQDFERTLDFVMELEGKPQLPLEKPSPPIITNIRSFGSDIDVDVHRSSSFVPNISRLSFQDKKIPEDHTSTVTRFSLQEKRVPDDPSNTVHRFPHQEKRVPEEPPTNTSRFSFPERKGPEELPKYNRPPIGGERKQDDAFKPRYPSVVERRQEDISRNRIFPEKRTDETVKSNNPSAFRTAREQFIVDQRKKNSGHCGNNSNNNAPSYAPRSKSLGTRRTLNSPFVLPIRDSNKSDENESVSNDSKHQNYADSDKQVDERLKNIEPKMVELIENEIMDSGAPVHWDDIAGLEFAKNTIKEIVVWPMLRPDIFTGLRGPPRGILLFGPPGTGKTLIGKCIASQSRSTFFSISASSLTSKWVGEGEKMVRALFAVARVHQPSVIFIDEIDSLLSQRSDTEHESSRRIKTEFLVQLDGATTSSDDRLLVVGATNRPQELDEAARRRLVKRLYIPLPEFAARKQIIHHLMGAQRHDLEEEQVNEICRRTDGYSCADMTNLCKEAAFGPIRSISLEDIEYITAEQVRPITCEDFEAALSQVRASVSTQDLALYEDWNGRYGSGAK